MTAAPAPAVLTVEVLTVEEVVALAVATLPRPATGAVLDRDERLAVARGAHDRAVTLAQAALAGVQQRQVFDGRCRRGFTVGRFIRHCADLQHTVDDVVVHDEQGEPRDLGRQGESRTAVDQW